MVNGAETFGIDPAMGHAERSLALSYALTDRREALAALFALDATLARLTRATRDPIVAQMRLTWWHEALSALPARIAGQPIVEALAGEVDRGRIVPAPLTALVEGWEALLEDAPIDHARGRGRALFGAAAALLGATDDTAAAGEGWALADLALHTPDRGAAAAARAAAAAPLAEALRRRWSRAGRPLGALALVARADLAGVPIGAPRRLAALVRLRLTGR